MKDDILIGLALLGLAFAVVSVIWWSVKTKSGRKFSGIK